MSDTRFNGRNSWPPFNGRYGLYNSRGGPRSGDSVIFSAPLTVSLAPTVGAGMPAFTRATTAYDIDWEAVLKPVLSGEARFQGARRVRNYVLNTTTYATADWHTSNVTVGTGVTDPGGGSTAATITATANGGYIYCQVQSGTSAANTYRNLIAIRRRTGTGVVSMYRADFGLDVDITSQLTTSWQLFTTAAAAGAANPGVRVTLATLGDAVDIAYPQVEDVTGQSNQNPSSPVSVGVLSAPYHGANVDGVKYFSTQNGNTVVANVVTEATGAAISSSVLLGYLAEGARTNLALWSRDLTNVAWVALNITPAKTATGADGVASSATTLTATAGNGTILQAIVASSAQRVTGCYIKRRTGSGDINMTQDNGGTWTVVPVTAGFVQVAIPAATAANPIIGFRIVTSGDAIDVDFVEHDEAAFISSPIPTTTASVTRNADVLSYAAAGNFNNVTGAVLATIILKGGAGTNQITFGDPSNRQIMNWRTVSSDVASTDGTNTSVWAWIPTIGTPSKVAQRWGASVIDLFSDGTKRAPTGTFDNNFDFTTFGVGCRGDGFPIFGTIKDVKAYSGAPTDAQMQALTT